MQTRALAAEFLGTFAYVAAICATMLLDPAAGHLAAALAAGLTTAAMMQSVGHISGGHFNPAVTLGLVAAGRFDMSDAVGFIVAQVLGGIAAAFAVSVVMGGAAGGKLGSFASISNTFGGRDQFSMASAMLIEIVAAAVLLVVLTGSTSRKASASAAPLAVGFAIVALHLITLPVTNAALNPARATATALLGGARPLGDLWVFWIAPIIGGVIGGMLGGWLQQE